MSQTQTLEIVEIPVDKIKPSPYQPRIAFDLEELRGSILKYGIRDPLKVRKIGGYYELIDGERRWRIAAQEGMKSVPCLMLNYTDEEADALAWRFNTERKDYSVEEKAKHFHKHQLEGMSARATARIHGYHHRTVASYLSIFRLPEKFQNYVWAGAFSFQKFESLYEKGLLNSNAGAPPPHTITLIQQSIDQDLKQKEFERVVDDLILDLKEKQVETARKVAATIDVSQRRIEIAKEEIGELEAKEPETPEELEEAAKVLMGEAKRRKTPEQILEEKREEARKSLLIGKGNAQSKIENAKEEGVDTSELERRLEKIKAKISTNPEEALEETKLLKEEVDKARKEHKAHVKAEKSLEKVESEIENAEELGLDMGELKERYDEVKNTIFSNPDEASKKFEKLAQKAKEMIEDFEQEQREAKIREEARREAEIEARTKLMEDEEFLKKATEKAGELTSYPEMPRIEPQSRIEIPIELKERAREMEEEYQAFLLRKDVKERGGDFENWMAHNYLLGALLSVRCPICDKGGHNLVWACGDHEALGIGEATEKLRKKLEAG